MNHRTIGLFLFLSGKYIYVFETHGIWPDNLLGSLGYYQPLQKFLYMYMHFSSSHGRPYVRSSGPCVGISRLHLISPKDIAVISCATNIAIVAELLLWHLTFHYS